MDNITFSVLLPNYNHRAFITRALDALVAQSKQADEILIIDDCSTDDSVSLIEGYRDRLPQLQLIRNTENVGVNRSTNRLLDIARSSHVVCTAADDWLEPQFIARMSDALSRFSHACVCVSAFVEWHDETGMISPEPTSSERGCWFATDGPRYFTAAELRDLLDKRFVWLPVNGAVFNRAALREVGGFDPALKWHADWFTMYTLALRQGFAVVPEPLAVFRVAASTYSGRGMLDPISERQVALAIYDKLCEPEFRDIYEALRRHPVALTTFFRQLVIGLAGRPGDWSYLAALLKWWIGEVMHGRRPEALRDFLSAWTKIRS